MPIEKIVDSLDSVDEALHGFYVEKDGKFHLEDVTALRNSMTHAKKERDEARKKATSISKWEKLGKTPEEIEALLAQQEENENKKLTDKGDFEALLAQHKGKFEKDLGAANQAVDFWKNKYQNADRTSNFSNALVKEKASAEGLELLPSILADRVKYEIEGDKITVKILSADKSTPMAGSGADGQATFADLVKEAKTKFPSLFEGNGHSGSGASDTGGKGGAHSNLKRSQMSIEQKSAFIAEHGQTEYMKLPEK